MNKEYNEKVSYCIISFNKMNLNLLLGMAIRLGLFHRNNKKQPYNEQLKRDTEMWKEGK